MSEAPNKTKEQYCVICGETWRLGHRCKPTPTPERRTRYMKSRPSIYACGCLDKVNKALAARNTVVETCFTMNFATGKQGEALLLHTAKVDPKKREKPLKVDINYCPWCGAKYE